MPSTVRRPRTPRALLLLLLFALVAAACSNGGGRDDGARPTVDDEETSGGPTTSLPLGGGTSPIQDGVRVEVLSSQPDRVTGDDARIRVSPPAGVAASELRVMLGDLDVTPELTLVDGSLEGVVEGFIEGTNTITATAGSEEVVQRIRAWPLTGPMISGPHLPLLACSTEEHDLGKPTDANCSAPTRVTYRYIDSEGNLKELASPSSMPEDVAVEEIDGRRVPLVVRYEQGVINRSVYEIASVDGSPTDEDLTNDGWNRKLVYRYGGGCGTTFGQGTSLTSALDAGLLRQGYAVATATFNTFQVQCNDVLSAETTMMVKERVVEELGRPLFTIGEGASGGSIQLHLLAQNYPGLINGAVALLPFPDALSMAPGVTDCGLLLRYYGTPEGKALSPAQRTALNGHASAETCQTWKETFLGGIDPTDGCDPKIPAEQVYDPERNPDGLRCTLQDANINQFGRDEATGFAKRPLDNVGVQYGLQALNEGVISVDQFLDLNEDIGGYDIDGGHQDERAEANPDDVLHVYETGRISMGAGDQRNIPILDINVFTDPTGDIHDRFRAFSLRDRLVGFGGRADDAPGFQIWTHDPGDVSLIDALGNVVSGGGFGREAVAVMDEWLTNLREDTTGGSMVASLLRNRPDAAVDNCLPADATEPLIGVGIYDEPGPCRDDFPIAGDPRTAAGAPRANDVLKCNLMAPDPSLYEVDISTQQFARLQSIFPTGVCNWDSPGVGETTPATPDRSYEDVESPGQAA